MTKCALAPFASGVFQKLIDDIAVAPLVKCITRKRRMPMLLPPGKGTRIAESTQWLSSIFMDYFSSVTVFTALPIPTKPVATSKPDKVVCLVTVVAPSGVVTVVSVVTHDARINADRIKAAYLIFMVCAFLRLVLSHARATLQF